VSACEFHIDQNDNVEVLKQVARNESEYQVLYIADGNTPVLIEAQKDNFTFMEVLIQIHWNINDVHIPNIYKRFEPYMSYMIADDYWVQYTREKILEGSIFSTDKVSRDTFFGQKKAGYRFACYFGDLINSGATLVMAKYKESVVGFNIVTDLGNGVLEADIGGLFPEYDGKGLGFAPIYSVLNCVRNSGNKKTIASVSSNNLPMLKVHEMFGAKIDSMTYVLTRHKSL
jgi:hypothetical protein